MTAIPSRLRDQVVQRAGNRCEYCGLSQAGQEAAFHVDHVVPQSVGGETSLSNLALACVSCSLRKGLALQRQTPKPAQTLRFSIRELRRGRSIFVGMAKLLCHSQRPAGQPWHARPQPLIDPRDTKRRCNSRPASARIKRRVKDLADSQRRVFVEQPLADTDVADIVLRQFGI